MKNKSLQKQLKFVSNELEVLQSKNEFLLEKELKETQLKSSNSALNEIPILKGKISNSCDHDKEPRRTSLIIL